MPQPISAARPPSPANTNFPRMKGLDLSPGTNVEVNIDSDNSSHVWFPATFVKQVTNKFLVASQRSRDAGFQSAIVDSLHIRPRPPSFNVVAFDLEEKVDARCDCRWLSGVVTKIIPDKRYMVYFKHTKKEEEVRHEDLRLCMEWIDGVWVFPSEDTSTISDSGKQSGVAVNNDSKQLEGGNQPSTPKEVEADCEKHPNKPKRGRPQKLPANDTARKSIRIQENIPQNALEKKNDNTPAKNFNNFPKRPDEMPMQSAAIVSKYDQDLPFKKISSFWEMIELMEFFKRIPQEPHFRPLCDSKEECRERLAIDSMASFISLVNKISRFQFGDPRSILVGYLDHLVKLEELGFSVGPVREKLNTMLSIIGESEKADNTSKEIQSQIMERNLEKSKIDEEIVGLDKKIADHNKKIAELNEKRALAMSKKEGKDAEITLLQSTVDNVKGSLEIFRVELEKVTASCW